MSVRDILCSGGGILFILMTVIQLSPLKIDPWSWLARTIGRGLNKELTEKVNGLSTKINELDANMHVVEGSVSDVDNKVDQLSIKVDQVDTRIDNLESKVTNLENRVIESECKNEERSIIQCRSRMLIFGDEILHGQKHSKDHFDQILLDCTAYNNYCKAHPEFLNSITEHTVELINSTYDDCLEKKSFL